MKLAPPTRLSFEPLEDRLTPTWGVPWADPTALTMSIAPDGTDISGSSNTLQALLGTASTAGQREILRAFQTWAVAANINIGLVADQGQGFGVGGQSQGDTRFGDIRVGARPLTLNSSSTLDLAAGIGFDHSGGGWSGDVILNSNYGFGVGDAPGQHDLFSVVLHEASHSFGFADDPTNPSSVLSPVYQVWTGIPAADVAALQALYGARPADAYEGMTGNNSLATAYDLTANGNLTAITGDITTLGDVDYYRFTTPSAGSGAAGLTVNLQTAGFSLLTAKVTVFDAQGNVVNSAVTTDPQNNNLSITLANYNPSTTYSVKVEGSGTDVFSAGGYRLRLSYTDANGAPVAVGTDAVTGAAHINTEAASNDTIWTAQTLGSYTQTRSTTFAAVGNINSATDTDWYRITPTAQTMYSGTLTASVVPQDNGQGGARARVTVFDSMGNELPATVVTNEFGEYTIQLNNQTPGMTYYLRVTAANPNGSQAVGGYALTASLDRAGVTHFDYMNTTTLTASANTLYSALSLNQGRLAQFSLSATTAPSATDQAVRMTLVDTAGNAVFTLAVVAGSPVVTGTVWLTAGTYTVVFTAATRDGSSLQNLVVSVSGRERSDPMDPYYIDALPGEGTSPPPPPMSPPPMSPPPMSPPPMSPPPMSPPPMSPPPMSPPPMSPPPMSPPPMSPPPMSPPPPMVPPPMAPPPMSPPPMSPPPPPPPPLVTTGDWFTMSASSSATPTGFLLIDPIATPFLGLN